MLWLLVHSSVLVLRNAFYQPPTKLHVSQTTRPTDSTATDLGFSVLPQLALPQLVLAVTTSFHVQIVNRLSSGYPIWYLVIAGWISTSKNAGKIDKAPEWVVRGIIMYCMIQSVLYASFLPPA
jgi:phosphatidylinositol glycan class V